MYQPGLRWKDKIEWKKSLKNMYSRIPFTWTYKTLKAPDIVGVYIDGNSMAKRIVTSKCRDGGSRHN